MPKEEKGYLQYFDEAWKKIIERLFPHLINFFVPEMYNDIDFSRGVSFLDKEMERLAKRSQKGAKYVDKLIKVYLKDGNEKWILVHIEVQSYADKEFPKRMFRYFYRIFDRFDKEIVSIALLTNSKTASKKREFKLQSYGSGVIFQYLSFGLMSYKRNLLSESNNLISLLVIISQEKELAKRKGDIFNTKLFLSKLIFESKFTENEKIAIFEFMDWALELNEEEDKIFWDEIKEIEEVRNMPYITSFERVAMKKGMQQGMQQGIQQGIQQGALKKNREMLLEALNIRFGNVPDEIAKIVESLEDENKLRLLFRNAIQCGSLDDFKKTLDNSGKK